MNPDLPGQLAADALADREIGDDAARRVLTDASIDLLPLLAAAFQVRRRHFGHQVQVHILNNAQNGHCPEDCAYCTQANTSAADIAAYPLKSDQEILAEAQRAFDAGAHRYCMVFAGRGPGRGRTEKLAQLVRTIKRRLPIEVCVSAGLLDDEKARVLADAGLDRLNHNLNTSRDHYPRICSTHTYDQRLDTLRAAQRAGLATCSGLIAGMGEGPDDLIEVARTLRRMGSASIPVNFLLPFDGNRLREPAGLTPRYCLRVLCLFRFQNPRAEIRCAAGREFHLRSMEVMCLYPANSLFLDGYLNGRGAESGRALEMIRDAGFTITREPATGPPAAVHEQPASVNVTIDGRTTSLKSMAELRPGRGVTGP